MTDFEINPICKYNVKLDDIKKLAFLNILWGF